jgi:hypothetical protein
MNTVKNEVRKWSEIRNHLDALAVNLLDNSESVNTLKRYSVLREYAVA